jgi:hypothetical protein
MTPLANPKLSTRGSKVPALTSRATLKNARGRSMTAEPRTRSGARSDWSALAPNAATLGLSFTA